MSVASLRLHSEDEQVAFGAALAAELQPGMVVFLEGELGAGKTTLARGIARGLGHRGPVKSPTYTLVEPYEALRIPLYHFDLYRLGDAQELEYLGVRDYFSAHALLVVEWPQRGETYLPAPDLRLRLVVAGDGRGLELESLSERGRQCIDATLRRYSASQEVSP